MYVVPVASKLAVVAKQRKQVRSRRPLPMQLGIESKHLPISDKYSNIMVS